MKNATETRHMPVSAPVLPEPQVATEKPARKGRLRLTLKHASPADKAFMTRLCQVFFIAGISLLLAGVGVWWFSHWVFGEILSPQSPEPQAMRMMAIWNVLMYFAPVTMMITGMALAFVPSLLSLIARVPDPVFTRRPPVQE